ncbi:MAG: hypothetical protein NT018_06330 [Armatimonadetes bacterium]|nr:hypothetical protein [Armatimonadota bacterium]
MSNTVRVGECRQCGECCRRLGWLCVNADDDTMQWIRARDPEILVVPDEAVEGYCWVSIPYLCTSLTDIGGGGFHCTLQESKPVQCKQYPESTDELKPGCGYHFIGSESAS